MKRLALLAAAVLVSGFALAVEPSEMLKDPALADTVVIINADASARHQSVVTVMEAARRVGLTQITFATQSSVQGGKR